MSRTLSTRRQPPRQRHDRRASALRAGRAQTARHEPPKAEQLVTQEARANASPRVHQLQALRDTLNPAVPTAQPETVQPETVQREAAPAPNRTGLPDRLKSGLESLSGRDLSGVRVHYNSSKPAQLNAHAYTQGQDIHVAPGQQRHVPHEGWHAVQQMEGRVRATTQLRSTPINDESHLEREADVMGARALCSGGAVQRREAPAPLPTATPGVVQRQLRIANRDITEEMITARDRSYVGRRYKKTLNPVISEEARGAHLQSVQVRNELVTMATDDAHHTFTTRREAVVAAIGRLTGVTEAEEALTPVLEEEEAFEGFPPEEIWRLLMDGKHQATRGKFGFENEKGYMAAMMRAFQAMLENVEDELTVDMYEQLHDIALGGVLDRRGEEMALGYRDSSLFGEGFGVDQDTMSEQGYQELLEKYAQRNKDTSRYGEGGHPVGFNLVASPEEMIGPDVQQKVVRIRPMRRTQAQRFVKLVLDLYHQEIGEAESEDDQVEAIARAAQDLDQLHVFVDGNIRTIAFLIVNKLLIQQGLDPVILDEPNVFDAKSVDELKAAIRRGQARFRSYRND